MGPRPWTLVFQACLTVATASCGENATPNASPAASGGIMGSEGGGDGGSLAGGAATGGAPGASGPAGAAGVAGSGAGTGSGTPEVCSFEIVAALSSAIPTVGVIDWSTDLAELGEAIIEFDLDDPLADEINTGSGGTIDITGTTHRALMLGLKPERTYTYRIVASGGGLVCTSPDRTLTTGASTGAPTVTRTVQNAAARARGFIVTTSGLGGQGFGGGPVGPQMAYIVDSDGEVVWWADSPPECTRALMDWEGANLWMLAAHPVATPSGEMRRIGMDGTGAENNVEGLERTHHDFTVLPGGIVAALSWNLDAGNAPTEVIERSPDGTIEVAAQLDGDIYTHTNSIQYHPADDSYTVGDLSKNAFVKLTRQNEMLWQFGGDCSASPAPKCAGGDWGLNHGHHLLDNGNLLLFNNAGVSEPATAHEYSLTEGATSLTASRIWSYTGATSSILGDVQRLPNGNTLVTFSIAGQIHEVSPSGALVQILGANTFGYASFRETLYGPPLR